MIDVEQRRLRALEHHVLAVGHHAMQRQRHVGHPRPHPLAGRDDLVEDRLPVERGVLDDAVPRADVLAHFLGQRVAIAEQIADANAPPPDLVLVGGSDASRRRANLALAAARLRQHVELAVVRQDDVRLLADEQPAVDADPGAPELVDLGKERLRIDDHAVADDARHAGMQDARRDQVQDELLPLDVHGVARRCGRPGSARPRKNAA